MITIRQGTFETNSSSTHSMVMMSEDTFKKWKNAEVYLNDNWLSSKSDFAKKDFVNLDEIRDIYEKANVQVPEIQADPDEYIYELNQSLKEDGFYTYENWGEDFEHDSDEFITSSGEKIICEAYYGYDG